MEVEFKSPPQENGAKKDDELPVKPFTDTEINRSPPSNSSKNTDQQPEKKKHKRSRSKTPQKKKKATEEKSEKEAKKKSDGSPKVSHSNTNGEEKLVEENGKDEKKETETEDPKQINGDEVSKSETENNEAPKQEPETVEMEALVLSDEPDPELQFDENSDMESGRNSPVLLSRCRTRRSQTRNIPTPKTPKSLDDDAEKNSTPTPDLVEIEVNLSKKTSDKIINDTTESVSSNSSTKVEVGSDTTRIDYMGEDLDLTEDSAYLNASRERSLSETLRNLSSRRSIRPIISDYRRNVLRCTVEKTDLSLPSYNSLDRISTGMKRKSRSETPEERKKFKSDSPGLLSMISSPLVSLKNKFRSDIPSSTPKGTGYNDNMLDYGDVYKNYTLGNCENDDKKSWCSIM